MIYNQKRTLLNYRESVPDLCESISHLRLHIISVADPGGCMGCYCTPLGLDTESAISLLPYLPTYQNLKVGQNL